MKTIIIIALLLLTSCATFDPYNPGHIEIARKKAIKRMAEKGYKPFFKVSAKIVVHKTKQDLKSSMTTKTKSDILGYYQSRPVNEIHLCEGLPEWVAVHEWEHVVLESSLIRFSKHHEIIDEKNRPFRVNMRRGLSILRR